MSTRVRVLLVEDEESAREALTLFLRLDDQEVFAAGCAAEALEILRSLAPPPDVVVTDYQLGRDITGADLIEQMRAVLGNEIPALILSGDAIRAARRCASIPKCKLLQKPVDAAALARYVREAAQQASPTR